jgi:hypothetical protein
MKILNLIGIITSAEHKREIERLQKQIEDLKRELVHQRGIKQTYKIPAGKP